MADAVDSTERHAQLLDALSRIRHLKDSKLENQRAPAQLLVAIEATLAERDAQGAASPTQYLLALESLLSADETSADVHASAVYLLSHVLPHVAPGVVRAKSLALLGAVAAPLADPHGPSENMNARVRASLGVVESLLDLVPATHRELLAKERNWIAVWDLVLNLCIDARPKVRRRAQELVAHVLGGAAWAHAHPYAERTLAWAVRTLEHVASARGAAPSKAAKAAKSAKPEYDKKSGKARHAMAAAAVRQQSAADGAASSGIWVCQLLQAIVPLVPVASTTPLVGALLSLPALQNPFLTVAVYDVFAAMFVMPRVDALGAAPTPVRDASLLQRTLAALRDDAQVPAHNDVQTLPAYFNVLESCLVAYAAADAAAAWALVPALWADTMRLALSAGSDASRASAGVRTAGRKLLEALARYCVPDAAVQEALGAPGAPLAQMCASVSEALGKHALRYAHARGDILHVLAALLRRLKIPLRPGDAPPAEALLMDTVEHVAALRTQKAMDARAEADAALGAAVAAVGPARFLERLPLQLLDDDGRPNAHGTGRAWLLPLLRAHISNTHLSHFVQYFLPLSEALFELRRKAEAPTDGAAARPIEAKVMEALIEQIWACFPGYCDLARDIDTTLTPNVLQVLVQVLRTQRALRPSVLKGLELLVERTESLVASQAPADDLRRQFGVSQADGRRAMAHLRTHAGALLASLFNVLAEMPAQARGAVMECIATYLAILDAPSVASTFQQVAAMLAQTMETYVPTAPAPGMPEPNSPRYVPPVPHTMLDLFIALVPHVRGDEAAAMLDACSRALRVADSGLQKKAYRALARLLQSDEAPALHQRFEPAQLLEAWIPLEVQAGAVRDRLALLATLVPHMPAAQLGTLASIVPEAVLGTKEVNQGAREAAYDLLVQLGHRMAQGGTIDRAHAGVDEAHESVQASVHEYIMMVAAGLAGASARMIGASITALARLLYEFHADLDAATRSELLSTVLVFLESTNREIVKGALAYCKVSLVSMPHDELAAALPALLPALLQVRRVHKNHFKSQVRHMVERLLRRFGEAGVEPYVDADNQRLLANIRKRKERAKRRRAAAGDDGDDDEAPPARTVGMDAFEEALYGSDSDDDDDDDDDDEAPQGGRRHAPLPSRRARHREDDTYLLEDNDTPMNLLDESAIGAIRTHAHHKAHRQPGQEARAFATDDMGRLRISEEDTPAAADDAPAAAAAASDGTAYLDKSIGVDGFTHRGRGGAVKFNKNNKRTRAQERFDEDDEPGSRPAAKEAPRRKRGKQAIGSEFRSRRAEGDVQKNGVSPYAYVPLSSVTGKKNAKQAAKLAITGKRRLGT